MDTKTQTLLPSPSLQCPMSLYQAQPGSPCLPSRPSSPHSSSPIPASLPLSPLAPSHSIPLSPTYSPPSALTSQTQAPPTLSPRLSSPPPSRSHDFLCPSLMSPGDQDDLTCLSWLHQRGDLLPLQPLPRTAPLPDLPHRDPFSTHMPPAMSKPPYSFSSLIFMAIEDSPEKRLPVKGIYDWIVKNFPYYRAAPSGWRNSVRHNLSLSKSFRRIHREKGQTVGKGSLWCVCPEYRPALLEVLRKTHHCHSSNRQLYSSPALLEEGDYGAEVMNGGVQITDTLSQTLLSSPSPPALSSDHPSLSSDTAIPLTADQEELVAMETIELQEEVCEEKDPLADSGYIEFHCYQYQQYQYLVLPGETEIDLETVEILQLDAEAQEAAGSLLDLAGGGH